MNKTNTCPCTKYDCTLHSNCKACIKKHQLKQQLPHCIFPDHNGDRSIKNYFYQLHKIYKDSK